MNYIVEVKHAWTTCSLRNERVCIEEEKSYSTQRRSNTAVDFALRAAAEKSNSNTGKPGDIRIHVDTGNSSSIASFQDEDECSSFDRHSGSVASDNSLSTVSSQYMQEHEVANSLASVPIETSSELSSQFLDDVDNLGSLEHLVQELQDSLHLAKRALSMQSKHSEQLATLRKQLQHSVSLPTMPALVVAPSAPYSRVPQNVPDPGSKPVKVNGFHKMLRNLSSNLPRYKKAIKSNAGQGSESVEPQTMIGSSCLEPQTKRGGAPVGFGKIRGVSYSSVRHPDDMCDGATRQSPVGSQGQRTPP
jgi:hypothetical protein